MLNTDQLKKAVKAIEKAEDVVITAHMRPDGDACGSMMALARCMNAMGKKVRPILLTPLAWWYNFLFDQMPEIMGNDITVEKLIESSRDTDLVVIVDTNSRVQLPGFADYLDSAGKNKTVLVIDHHVTGDDLGDIQLIDNSAAATGEVIHEMFKYAGWEITTQVAEALFVAISTDTGWFRYSSADGRLFRDAADLLDAGVNPVMIYRQMFQNFTAERMKLLSLVLSRIQLHFDNRVATQYILRKDFDDTGTSGPDTENMIDECQRISSVDVAAMFVELKDGSFRCSLRSKGPVDVRKIAQAHGGGGHIMAAGVNLPGPLDNAVKLILDAVDLQINPQ